jgi:hypothetical protein
VIVVFAFVAFVSSGYRVLSAPGFAGSRFSGMLSRPITRGLWAIPHPKTAGRARGGRACPLRARSRAIAGGLWASRLCLLRGSWQRPSPMALGRPNKASRSR